MNGKWLYSQCWPGRCQNVDLIGLNVNSMYHNIIEIWDEIWQHVYPQSNHSEHLSNHVAPTLATIRSFTALSFHTWRYFPTLAQLFWPPPLEGTIDGGSLLMDCLSFVLPTRDLTPTHSLSPTPSRCLKRLHGSSHA